MGRIAHSMARLFMAAKHAYARKWAFLAIFMCVFGVGVGILAALDLLPEAKPAAAYESELVAKPEAEKPIRTASASEFPVRVVIEKIGINAPIVNPESTLVSVLDENLLLGAVRYPTSARLGEEGNVVLFGHSSYLPIVANQAFKTFNGIQKLVPGDTVTVYSSGTAYTYRVRSMKKENADTAGIPLLVDGRVLTLSTCDSFGTKSDRFVVTADFVGSHPVSSS